MSSHSLCKISIVLFVAGNLLGVFPIVGEAGVYRPYEFSLWMNSIRSVPSAHILSAILFQIGALSGVLTGRYLERDGHTFGGIALRLGSLWNALWIPVPLCLALLSNHGFTLETSATSIALWMALFADAMFNLFLGLSMLSIGWNIRTDSPKMGWSALLIGLLTVGVGGQFHFKEAAELLGVAGPLWLIWWLDFAFFYPKITQR